MTLNNEIIELNCRGICCKSDFGLYERVEDGPLHLLSIYGAPQQTKAMLSLYASYKPVTASDRTFYRSSDLIRFKTFPIGYGKSHGLLKTEMVGKSVIVWQKPEEKHIRFMAALNKRKIPYDVKWLPEIIDLFRKHDIIEDLAGWGGIGGYLCNWNDDDYICDIICEYFGNKQQRKAA